MRIIAVFMACTLMLQAGVQPEPVAWNRTPEVLARKRVIVQLTRGAKVEGDWIGVTAETFTMKVEKTSNRHLVNKGIQTLPRSSILAIRAGNRHIRGRVIGSIAGMYS